MRPRPTNLYIIFEEHEDYDAPILYFDEAVFKEIIENWLDKDYPKSWKPYYKVLKVKMDYDEGEIIQPKDVLGLDK